MPAPWMGPAEREPEMDSRLASWKVVLVALALSTGVGCGDDDAPPITDTDAGMGGSDLPVLSTGTMDMPASGTPDYACLGSRVQPTAGEPVASTFELRDFETDAPVANARVWLFPDNAVRDACDGTCTEFMTDASGNAAVNLPADGWYAYRVFPRTGATATMRVVDSMQYNEPAPSEAGRSVTGNSVSEGTLGLIPAVLGVRRQPGTALLAGTVVDCDETPVYGARVRAFDGDTEIEMGTEVTSPQYRYFNGDSFPSDTGTFTHADGLYVGVQIPVPAAASDRLRIEAWGRPTADGPEERIGCEAVRVLADAVTIVNLGPERSDYEAGHPCAE